ncbi:MAG: divergent polysaccharide deacetylase family protein [Chromatiales bacterium]|nr:divergent polysaccharide deacetylase family protein [Chromatiales bacterium]
MVPRSLSFIALFLALTAQAGEVGVPGGGDPRPVVALIIDDLGDRLYDGRRAIELPGNVTYSILPRTTYSRKLSELAYGHGKEVMMHQPMEAVGGAPMGPGGLSQGMGRQAFVEALHRNFASVPHARGINNHMGSLLTRQPLQMAWLMEELRWRGNLYFVDSTTTSQTVALKVANSYRLPGLRRNIFLDHTREEGAIRDQFDRLVSQARAVGSSLAIAHPYPETLMILEQMLPTLKQQGIDLVSVSDLIRLRYEQREPLWQASLSPSPMAAKSLKQ